MKNAVISDICGLEIHECGDSGEDSFVLKLRNKTKASLELRVRKEDLLRLATTFESVVQDFEVRGK